MARIMRETHEHGKTLTTLADHAVAEGCGDARSTEDNQDNITCQEGRGITIGNVLDNKRQLQIDETTVIRKRYKKIDHLSQKKRKDMTSREKVRLLQLKLYQKAKQESSTSSIFSMTKFSCAHTGRSLLRCKAKAGSPGVDKVSFQIEQTGEGAFLERSGKSCATQHTSLAGQTCLDRERKRRTAPAGNTHDQGQGCTASL
jgi:hypothetical protein